MEVQTGRRVTAVISGTEIEPDISSQVFVLGERVGDADSEGAKRLVNTAGSSAHGPTQLASAAGE